MIKSTYKFEDHSVLANVLVLLCLIPATIVFLAAIMVCVPVLVLSWLPVAGIARVDNLLGKKYGSPYQPGDALPLSKNVPDLPRPPRTPRSR